MNLDALRTVALVADRASFAEAARVLSVDPSTVSRIVAGVEANLGMRLFHRTTRALSLTEGGAAYLGAVRGPLDALEAAADAARGHSGIPSGLLRMTASVAFASECIVPHLAEFEEKFPALSVELLLTDVAVDLVAERIDLAIRLAASPHGDVIARRLLETRYRVCAAPSWISRHGWPDGPECLSELNCLRLDLQDFREAWRFRRKDGSGEVKVRVDGRFVISSPLALRQAAITGLGPALLADWMTQDARDTGVLIDLFPDHYATATEFDTGVWAIYPNRSFLPVRVGAMIDFLSDRL
ncbi:MAG: LysR family transcriptional regulator [Pseudomonadota bacterium]